MSTANLAELLDVLVRREGLDETAVRSLVDPILDSGVRSVPVSLELALAGASLRTRHYHRRDCPVSLADCFALATAMTVGRLATSDEPLARVARVEGVEVIPLPNSDGVTP